MSSGEGSKTALLVYSNQGQPGAGRQLWGSQSKGKEKPEPRDSHCHRDKSPRANLYWCRGCGSLSSTYQGPSTGRALWASDCSHVSPSPALGHRQLAEACALSYQGNWAMEEETPCPPPPRGCSKHSPNRGRLLTSPLLPCTGVCLCSEGGCRVQGLWCIWPLLGILTPVPSPLTPQGRRPSDPDLQLVGTAALRRSLLY